MIRAANGLRLRSCISTNSKPRLSGGACLLAWLATAGMLCPRPVAAGPPEPCDIVAESQQISGTLMGPTGKPVPGVLVQLAPVDQSWRMTIPSGGAGEFRFPLSTGGLYQLACGTQVMTLRAWPEGTQPPSAVRSVQLTLSEDFVVRGQQPLCGWAMTEPLMIGVLVAAAIAIPLAVHSSDDAPPGS